MSANGASLLTNFDIYGSSGSQYRAIVEKFGVTANATTAAVNGIEIY